MGEQTRPNLNWRTRLWAWWEGYRLPGQGPGGAEKAAPAPDKVKQKDSPALSPANDGRHNISRFGKPIWTATRIQVAEKIWGEGYATPGADDFIPYLVKPLGLTPAMSVLDMSAGLGGTTRFMASTYGCWVTGLEASPVLAAVGQERTAGASMVRQASIAHYDPETFQPPPRKRFDCIFAKEAFAFVKNREALTEAVSACLKPKGQLLFTDYVLGGSDEIGPAVRVWADREPVEPHVQTVAQVSRSLQKNEFDVRITEDITKRHRSQIVRSIQQLIGFLEHHRLDPETKVAVIDEVELWARRVSALDAGLRCYRFLAIKFNEF
jgi:SAM-dependent methyltransferase